ncbi:hypothetical protein [Minwuia thermotolerans]|uniref:Uncharacterized protein n=1 Tax=Minwuia thermotolerans TaxID=2056226 RepID=A0A2M9G2J4_9PROT|nr:hypothetical protein [Minwuia thermotolerans]PJK29942.1 hypothetical protein CVT23_09240 [Minwuia thermotolerans]
MMQYRNQGAAPASAPMKREMDVEDLLVWAFREQQVQAVLGRTAAARMAGPAMYARDSTVVLAKIAELGCWVDGGGAPSDRIHGDAVEVWSAVAHLPAAQAGAVAHYAQAGAAPEWPGDIELRWIPRRDTRGRVAYEFSDSQRRDGKYTPVRLYPNWESVELMMQAWNDWVDGLSLVCKLLEGRLEDHAALPSGRSKWRA